MWSAIASLLVAPETMMLVVLGVALVCAPLPALIGAEMRYVQRGGFWRGATDRESSVQRYGTAGALARVLVRHPVPLVSVTALAGGLRLFQLTKLSLWLDEGATVYFATKSWPVVLGLEGAYDFHPPLYFALVKLVSLAVPVVDAARGISAIAGTLTVPILYLLTARLVDRRAAFAASLVLACSPLHVWYSQEARMFALSVFLVCVSYWALVATMQSGQWWSVLYGVAVLLAMYVSYSSAYALVPQIFVLALSYRANRRRAVPLLAATLLAILAYLPWAYQAYRSFQTIGSDRAVNDASRDYLMVSQQKVADAFLAVVGLSGQSSFYWGDVRTPWVALPNQHGTLLLLVVPTLLIAGVALWRAFPATTLVLLGLFVGTIGTAILASLLSPGFADRTVVTAVLGWAILAGAAPFGRTPNGFRAMGIGCLACFLILSGLSLVAIYRDASKQEYRALANDAVVANNLGIPVVVEEGYTRALIHAYAPDLPVLSREDVGTTEAVWVAYADYPWDDVAGLKRRLEASGYRAILHKYHPDPLYIDLYVKPGATMGAMVALPASPSDEGTAATTATDRRLTVIEAQPGALYVAESGVGESTSVGLACLDHAGRAIASFSSESHGGEEGMPVSVAALCPPATSQLAVTRASAPPAERGAETIRLIERLAGTGSGR